MSVLVALAVAAVTAQVALLATTVYLHRGVTHGALTLHPIAAFPLRFILWVATGIRPREWAGVHRRHHARTDTKDDPHSPAMVGFWRVLLTNAFMYRRAARDRERVLHYTRDLRPNRLDRYLFDHEILGPVLGAGLLCLVFGWQVGLIASALHSVLYVALNGAVNSIGHTAGTRPQENSGTNGRLLALLTAGEGLHNNHHHTPTAARLSWRRLELDPGWWLIWSLQRVGLAELRHPGGVRTATPRVHVTV